MDRARAHSTLSSSSAELKRTAPGPRRRLAVAFLFRFVTLTNLIPITEISSLFRLKNFKHILGYSDFLFSERVHLLFKFKGTACACGGGDGSICLHSRVVHINGGDGIRGVRGAAGAHQGRGRARLVSPYGHTSRGHPPHSRWRRRHGRTHTIYKYIYYILTIIKYVYLPFCFVFLFWSMNVCSMRIEIYIAHHP